MNRTNLIFCVASVVASVALSAALFPFTTVSAEELEAARTPVEASDDVKVNVGDFGTVSVLDLVGYYIENPPTPDPGGKKKVRFQGC